MICYKEIKEYSKRKRINIVKNDGFKTGETVVVLSKNDYESIITENKDLKHELEKTNDSNFDNLLEIAIKPIVDNYEKQINKLDNQLKDKDKMINDLKGVFTRFVTGFSTLSAIDVIFRSKHKELIKEFQDNIYMKYDQVAEVEKLSATKR